MILQQTRTDQGTSCYLRFAEHYPTVSDLAIAPLDEIPKFWEGLGYYSCTRSLHRTTQLIVHELDGTFPADYQSIRALPGIGDCTAGTVLSSAYDQPCPAVDGNMLRVLSRLYASKEPIGTTQGKKYYTTLTRQLIEEAPHLGLHSQATIKLGALICTPRLCDYTRCPVHSECPSVDSPERASLPHRALKLPVQPRYLGYLSVPRRGLDQQQTVLYQRPAGDIWTRLYRPALLYDQPVAPQEELLLQPSPESPAALAHCLPHPFRRYKYRLMHRQLYIDCYYTTLPDSSTPRLPDNGVWVPLHGESEWLALPITLKKASQQLTSHTEIAK